MNEMKKLEKYLENTLSKKPIEVREGAGSESWELFIGGEFFGTIYKDIEDGETNYDLNISVLGEDLK